MYKYRVSEHANRVSFTNGTVIFIQSKPKTTIFKNAQ